MMKPFPFPKEKTQDDNLTGFYSSKNSSQLNLRVQETDKELNGIIRLNKTSSSSSDYVFEGYNGKKWVQFNALKGEKGDEGINKLNTYQFENINYSDSNNKGLILKNVEEDGDNKKIVFRNLVSTPTNYNNNQMSINTLNIETSENNIVLTSNPQPYKWDISNLSINEMKTDTTSTRSVSNCYGDISIITIKKGVSIERGQFVSLEEENNKLVGVPFNYEGTLNLFMNPISVYGVALESINTIDSNNNNNNNNKLKVCIRGITTVKYCEDNSKIDDNLMSLKQVEKIGTNGLLSKDGYIFNCPIKPNSGIDYMKVGTFIETGENDYYLFNVSI